MKKLLIATSVSLFFLACVPSVSARTPDDLHLNVRLTTGERSKDSSSQTTAITVEGDATPPSKKEFKLSSADQQNLIKLIQSNNLLVTDSIELPRKSANYRYFEISVALALDGKAGAISINGMRTAVEVKEEKLYQTTMTLVKELYRIMSLQDKSIRFEDLVEEP